MTETAFETALTGRVEQMLDACTRCGKCVEACPTIAPAGIDAADPQAVISGIIDIVKSGEGPEASRAWASACMLSGECIKACDYGVNPRFLLAMARGAMAKTGELPSRRRQAIESFRNLGQGANGAATQAATEAPDFVFYTGCNVLKTPHIALLALDIMDALGVTYRVMGGPSHCCGVIQLRAGDVETSGRVATNTLDKLAQGKSGVLSWCPSCHVQFTETTLPTIEKVRGARPFEMTPFMLFLHGRLDRLRPLLRQRVDM